MRAWWLKKIQFLYFRNHCLFICVSGFTYPIMAHWVNLENVGWLWKYGFYDYNGVGSLHLLAGTCAFFAAMITGPRHGRFNPENKNKIIKCHTEVWIKQITIS